MKKCIIAAVGLVFFPIGYWVNDLILSERISPALYLPMGLLVLLLWFCWGMASNFLFSEMKQALVWSNSIPFCVVLLVLFQEFILKRYFPGTIGIMGQMYYLPLIRLSTLLWPFNGSMGWVYLTAFLLLVGACYLGRGLGPQRKVAP